MSETNKKIEILMRAASGVALGAALGSSVGLVAGSAIGSLILPGAGTLIGAAIGASFSSISIKNLLRRVRSSDEKLLIILDSIAENDESLKEDILGILEARIEISHEDDVKELLIKMRIAVNLADLQHPQKIELANHIKAMAKELRNNEVSAAKYFLQRISGLIQDYPNILAVYRELENFL